ncbi:collagen alpha-1(I) chain-like [Ovis canadensis]|uniref:collagen alpha-1(I) chain-like n=1 Tax=Ovis canadensis TaxID=37174 RepID=UPI0037536029
MHQAYETCREDDSTIRTAGSRQTNSNSAGLRGGRPITHNKTRQYKSILPKRANTLLTKTPNLHIYLKSEWAVNTAQNLEDELQDHKETELAEAQQRLPGPRSPRGGRGRGSAPGTSGAPGQSLRGSLLALSPRLPGGGRGRHLLDGPSRTAAASRGRARGGRPSGRQGPGGSPRPSPGSWAAAGPVPSRTPGPERDRRRPGEPVRKPPPRPAPPEPVPPTPPAAAPTPPAARPRPAALGPCGPRSGARPISAARRCARAEAPARPPAAPSLTARRSRLRRRRRREYRTPPGPGAAAQARTRALGDAAPSGLGGDPHAGWFCFSEEP